MILDGLKRLKGITVLSLFDGMSCGQIALERAGIEINKYYASEIDKHAIRITQANYPDTVQLGSVVDIKASNLPKIDLLLGGSPCTSLSIAKRQKESGLKKGDSVLFWEYVRLLKECKPNYFLLENVASMKNADRDKISETLGVKEIKINSALVSAQMRKRYYWTNIPDIAQPEDKKTYLKDILESGFTEKDKSYCITKTYSRACLKDYIEYRQRQLVFNQPVKIGLCGNSDSQGNRVYHINGKSVSLVANGGGKGAKTGLYETLKRHCRKLTAKECERLQTVPEGYTDKELSENQRIKLLGNGWTVDIIAHIFNGLKGNKDVK